MDFKVIARQHGDSVEFMVDAVDVQGALVAARKEANRIFGYQDGHGDVRPVVTVKPVPEET